MICRIQVLHYRALKYIDVKLSNFHILVGPNASGKSTFLDVINLVKDILNKNPHMAVERRASHFDELLWKQQGDRFEKIITKFFSICSFSTQVDSCWMAKGNL